jgi:hypothetical protein
MQFGRPTDPAPPLAVVDETLVRQHLLPIFDFGRIWRPKVWIFQSFPAPQARPAQGDFRRVVKDLRLNEEGRNMVFSAG